jgi:hypothetical protein
MKPFNPLRQLAALALLFSCNAVFAADPPEGTLSEASPELAYTAGPFVISNPSGVCLSATVCDEFTIHVELPEDYATTHPSATIDVEVLWDNTSEDFDLAVLENGATLSSDGSFAGGREFVSVPAGQGLRTLISQVNAFLVSGGSFNATVKLIPGEAAGEEPPIPSNTTFGGPRMDIYRPPAELGPLSADEPTLDVNMGSDNVFMVYHTTTIKTEFDDTYSPALTTWSDVTEPTNEVAGTLDPILVSDFAYDAEGYPDPEQFTRIFVLQLAGAGSVQSFTDDEGASWLTNFAGGQPHGADNESMAAGPYAPGGLPTVSAYRHAVYYCSHAVVNATCSRSDNGGLSFNNSVPIFTVNEGASLACNNHGHVKVGIDGTVYVPQETCGSASGVVVSENNGLNWEYRPIPGAGPGKSDTSAAIARDGTLYMGYANGNDGRPWVAVSKDHGRTYIYNQPVDGTLGLHNSVWVECVAGDPDRAACAFHGTTTPGDGSAGDFPGVWYTYLVVTYDGGASWLLQELTPGDPVQRGGICLNGLGCPAAPPNRNLLDFFDVVLDSKGRIVVGYADGCVGVCLRTNGPPTYSRKGVVARQAGGKGLFAKFDPPAATAPKGPLITGKRDERDVEIQWIAPYDGGAEITGYKVYRGTASGALTEHAQTTKPFFADHDVGPDATYFYQVSALNSVGESVRSNEISPAVGDGIVADALPCELPGVVVVQDAEGDTATPGTAQGDIQYVGMAEPFELADRLVFTLKVADLSVVPQGLRWTVRFQTPTPPEEGDDWFVSMSTQQSATPTFKYGVTEVIEDPAVGLAGARIFTELGDLDPASAYSADGTIVLILDKAAIGSPGPGTFLTGIAGSVRTVVTPQNNGIIDDTGDGQFYEIVGNAACDLASAPLAVLTATPNGGPAPLRVTLDGRDSAAPDGSQITTWFFDFNDGETLESDTGLVEHVYAAPGLYRPRLSVRDSKNRLSTNVAQIDLVVGNAVPGGGGGGVMQETKRFGGGLGLPLLAGLLAGVLLRRRLRA